MLFSVSNHLISIDDCLLNESMLWIEQWDTESGFHLTPSSEFPRLGWWHSACFFWGELAKKFLVQKTHWERSRALTVYQEDLDSSPDSAICYLEEFTIPLSGAICKASEGKSAEQTREAKKVDPPQDCQSKTSQKGPPFLCPIPHPGRWGPCHWKASTLLRVCQFLWCRTSGSGVPAGLTLSSWNSECLWALFPSHRVLHVSLWATSKWPLV
jgi:hypothetical protein